MPTPVELSDMSGVDIQSLDLQSLGDLEEAMQGGAEEAVHRYRRYLDVLQNPYCFAYKGRKVKLSFKGQGTLEQNLAALLENHR